MSYLDGTDEDIYVYNDKIIVEENSYFPIGQYSYTHCKIITIYKGINDPEKIKEEKKSKRRKTKTIENSKQNII